MLVVPHHRRRARAVWEPRGGVGLAHQLLPRPRPGDPLGVGREHSNPRGQRQLHPVPLQAQSVRRPHRRIEEEENRQPVVQAARLRDIGREAGRLGQERRRRDVVRGRRDWHRHCVGRCPDRSQRVGERLQQRQLDGPRGLLRSSCPRRSLLVDGCVPPLALRLRSVASPTCVFVPRLPAAFRTATGARNRHCPLTTLHTGGGSYSSGKAGWVGVKDDRQAKDASQVLGLKVKVCRTGACLRCRGAGSIPLPMGHCGRRRAASCTPGRLVNRSLARRPLWSQSRASASCNARQFLCFRGQFQDVQGRHDRCDTQWPSSCPRVQAALTEGRSSLPAQRVSNPAVA